MQLYGPVRKAPPVFEAATADAGNASLQQLPPATAQQMAACLATPFTGTDKNMGEILRSKVDRLNADQELKTQLRWGSSSLHLLLPYLGMRTASLEAAGAT